jgi:biotin operon repressor
VVVAVWFYDDGNINQKKHYPNLLEITLATNSFTYEEVMFLKELLSNRYNEQFRIDTVKSRQGKNKGQLQFTIRAGNSATRTIAKDIEQANVLGMTRKSDRWNDPLVHLYDNFYEEGREFSSKQTELKIIDFILQNYNNENHIMSSELSNKLQISRELINKNLVRMRQVGAIIKCNDHVEGYIRGTYYRMNDTLLRQYKQDHF